MKAFKKTRFVISAILVLSVLVLCMMGCSDIKKAKLAGYDGQSFDDTMADCFKYMKDEDTEVSAEWKEGWRGSNAPKSLDLEKHEKEMTYVVEIDIDWEGDEYDEHNRIMFYMIHDTKENVLHVQGASMEEDGDRYSLSRSEAREMLFEIFDEYN